MNAIKTLFALVAMTIALGASASDRSAQIMSERNVPPSVLADRIERECVRRGTVVPNCKPPGSNATVSQLRDSINANPEGKVLVPTLAQLPQFLRSLKKGPFDTAQCLAGMKGAELAAYCSNVREPHPGEVAWWHGDTFVLAGDCLNARVGYKPMERTEVISQPYKERIRERKDPFAGVRKQVAEGCPFAAEDRHFGVIVFGEAAARHECAARTMLPYGGHLGAREGGGNGGSYHDPNRFSRTCGTPLRAAWKAGQLALSTTPHQFEVVIEKDDGKDAVLFVGTVTGNVITALDGDSAGVLHESGKLIYLPPEYTSGDLVVRFLNPSGLRTPTDSGIGERVANIRRGCDIGAFHAIDASRTDVASRE